MNKVILGTAQFGLNYGINNKKGQPTQKETAAILDYAWSVGIDMLDTAMHYGNALEVIGNYHGQRKHRFKLISKFQEHADLDLKEHVEATLDKLKITALEGLLCHSFDFFTREDRLRQQLFYLKQKGYIHKIGVSIYSKQQLFYLLDNQLHIDIIQLPYNLLDNYANKGQLIKKASQKGIEIHTRSAFLQGLFFRPLDTLPEKIQPLRPYLEQIHNISQELSIPMHQLALNYAAENADISKVIIGVDSLEQLKSNLSAVQPKLIGEKWLTTLNQITVKEQSLLQPVNW